jgi:hypothetical protein
MVGSSKSITDVLSLSGTVGYREYVAQVKGAGELLGLITIDWLQAISTKLKTWRRNSRIGQMGISFLAALSLPLVFSGGFEAFVLDMVTSRLGLGAAMALLRTIQGVVAAVAIAALLVLVPRLDNWLLQRKTGFWCDFGSKFLVVTGLFVWMNRRSEDPFNTDQAKFNPFVAMDVTALALRTACRKELKRFEYEVDQLNHQIVRLPKVLLLSEPDSPERKTVSIFLGRIGVALGKGDIRSLWAARNTLHELRADIVLPKSRLSVILKEYPGLIPAVISIGATIIIALLHL